MIDKTSWKETIIPQAHNILRHMTFQTKSLSITEKDSKEGLEFLNDKYNLY